LKSRLSHTRRRWLKRALTLIAAGVAGSGASVLSTVQADESNTPLSALSAFMTISQALTGKALLDRSVGARLLSALQKNTPDLPQRLQQLAAALLAVTAAGLSKAPAAPQALALQIMQAWYLGVVDHTVVTYEQALMFAAVSDTLPIRSYCAGRPGFWAEKPLENAIESTS
jgi:hypothetical protein